MTDFNPLAGSILGSAQTQRQLDVQKAAQLRRSQAARKNAAAPDDALEHQVESSQEVAPVYDEDRDRRDPPRKHGRGAPDDREDDRPHVDVRA